MDNLFHQPQGGNEMPRFAGRATMMRLPFIEDLQGLDARICRHSAGYRHLAALGHALRTTLYSRRIGDDPSVQYGDRRRAVRLAVGG